jgi:hypothetical protein
LSRCSEIYTTTTSKTISGTTCDPTVISKTMLDLFVFFLSSNCATFSFYKYENISIAARRSHHIHADISTCKFCKMKYWYFLIIRITTRNMDEKVAQLLLRKKTNKSSMVSIYTNLKFSFSWQTTANLKMMVRTFDLNFHQKFFI